MQTHLVNRLRFEMICSTDEQAMRVGADVGRTLQPLMLSAIDRICSQYVGEDQWVKLDVLEIQLPDFYADFPDDTLFETQFAERFEAALRERLEPFTTTSGSSSRQQTNLDTLLHFLQTGQLPWWAVDETTDLEAMLTELIRQQPDSLRSALPAIVRSESVLRRMVYQFTPDTLTELIDRCFPELVEWVPIEPILERLTASEPSGQIDARSRQAIRVEVHLSLIPYVAHRPTLISNLPQAVSRLASLSDQPYSAGLSTETTMSGEPTSPEETTHFAALPEQETVSDGKETEKYLVKNAGIVLLAPFLTPFFTGLGWVEKGEFVDQTAQYKALHSLHYLATGQTRAPEYRLTLSKLLCGIPPNAPVPRTIDLREADYREADTMLTDVISHWTALKNTSANGLREGFLKRDGVLIFANAGWELRVEQQTIDVLIDTIPWGFSVTKLPWMPNILYTQW